VRFRSMCLVFWASHTITFRRFRFWRIDQIAFCRRCWRLIKPNLTAAEFAKALETKLQTVYAYRVTVTFNMNPFTMIRHALYSYDSAVYASLLFPNQRGMFGAWLEAHEAQAQAAAV
jgi:hypothetical protein